MSDAGDGYTGPAVLTVDGRELTVQVVLDARHEPQDGRLHWFGRLTPADAGALTSTTGTVVLAADGPAVPAKLGDVDPWGRYRVTGVGTPPFLLPEPALED